MREACRNAPNAAFDYGDPRGDQKLREVLAAYLRRVRAVDASADRIVVCAGFQQGLTIVLNALAGRSLRLVAVEDPGLDRHRDGGARVRRAATACRFRSMTLGIDVRRSTPAAPGSSW